MSRVSKTFIFAMCIAFLVIGCGVSKKAGVVKPDGDSDKTAKADTVIKKDGGAEGDGANNRIEDRNWEEHARVKLGTVYYYEKETISYPYRGLVKVWRKRVLPERMTDKEIVSLDEIDCKNEKYRSVFIQVVRKNDKVETFKKTSQDWTTVFADSPEEFFIEKFCGEANKVK